MNHHALNSVRWTSVLCVLLWLSACASAPTVLTEVETVEVRVPVRTPMPDDCFADHAVAPLPAEGALTIRMFDAWAEGLAQAIDRYRVQVQRCRELNDQRLAAPLEEP